MPSPQHFDGLEEDEITWYSNASFLHKAAYLGLEGSKLQGAQTGFLRCADEFPAWKGELHGTQTHRNIQETTNLVWKKVKLHGTQTTRWLRSKPNMLWRRVKLHGAQTWFCVWA